MGKSAAKRHRLYKKTCAKRQKLEWINEYQYKIFIPLISPGITEKSVTEVVIQFLRCQNFNCDQSSTKVKIFHPYNNETNSSVSVGWVKLCSMSQVNALLQKKWLRVFNGNTGKSEKIQFNKFKPIICHSKRKPNNLDNRQTQISGSKKREFDAMKNSTEEREHDYNELEQEHEELQGDYADLQDENYNLEENCKALEIKSQHLMEEKSQNFILYQELQKDKKELQERYDDLETKNQEFQESAQAIETKYGEVCILAKKELLEKNEKVLECQNLHENLQEFKTRCEELEVERDNFQIQNQKLVEKLENFKRLGLKKQQLNSEVIKIDNEMVAEIQSD